MPEPTWRVGAFADRFTEAREIGYALSTEMRSLEALFATAGQRAYLSASCPVGTGDCCCPRPPAEDGFAEVYPDAVKTIAEDRAFAAALRDITADPDLEDVAGAVAIATELHDASELAARYMPAVPMKKMPDGSDAPARCPVCGAVACATCGRACLCMPMNPDDAPAE